MKLIYSLMMGSCILIQLSYAETFCAVEGVASNDVLNVRAEANRNSKIISILYPDDSSYKDKNQKFNLIKCRTLADKSTWCKVIIYTADKQAKIGWVNGNYIDCYVENHARIDL